MLQRVLSLSPTEIDVLSSTSLWELDIVVYMVVKAASCDVRLAVTPQGKSSAILSAMSKKTRHSSETHCRSEGGFSWQKIYIFNETRRRRVFANNSLGLNEEIPTRRYVII